MVPSSDRFVKAIHRFARDHDIPLVDFKKGQRKDDVARKYLARFQGKEGILFIGRAQEKATVFRTQKRRNPNTGKGYPWIYRSTAMVNHFYFYGVDKDFGPFFLKFCTYFPYNAKLCINGHEYAKRQLAQEGIPFEALDNGFLSCEDPERLQAICDGLSPAKIEALLRKWLRRLPHPFSRADQEAGYRYDISILQAEFSLTQILDRPLSARIFFEEVIRENIDIGRPDLVQMVFKRRVTKRTPGIFRTRVITDGVVPALYIDYKSARMKQYLKEGRGLRTETTFNNQRDFGIGKRLHNLPALREIGFQANRRLLDVQTISHDCSIGEDAYNHITHPVRVNTQRASALRYGDPTVQALFHALVLFRLFAHGFSNRELRELLAPLLGLDPSHMTQGKMTYQLRRLRLHGLIHRIPGRHRYLVTDRGLRAALFFTRSYARLIRPGMAHALPDAIAPDSQLRHAFDRLERLMDRFAQEAHLAA